MAATSAKPVIKGEERRKDLPPWLEYFKAFGPWSLTVIATVWSIYSFGIQQRNLLNQIALQQQSIIRAQELDAQRLSTELLQWIKCEADERREIALEKLRISAPEQLRIVLATLEKCPKPGASMPILENLRQQGSENELQKQFTQLVNNARQYQRNGLDGPAARTFAKAADSLPQSYLDNHTVDLDQLSRAQDAFSDARFSTASDLFGQVFRKVPSDLN